MTVSALSHAQAALKIAAELGMPVTLISLPYGAASVGPGWFKAVVDRACATHSEVAVTAILDCGDRPDLVQAALRHGLRDVCYRGGARVRRKLTEIAAQYGGTVHDRLPQALDLSNAADPAAACRSWLGAGPAD